MQRSPDYNYYETQIPVDINTGLRSRDSQVMYYQNPYRDIYDTHVPLQSIDVNPLPASPLTPPTQSNPPTETNKKSEHMKSNNTDGSDSIFSRINIYGIFLIGMIMVFIVILIKSIRDLIYVTGKLIKKILKMANKLPATIQ